ncbi:hypothetical protein [Paraburkholderia sp.]|uniref:hypothetical protein n=1 Tax=Paraburkholderia sp. TaxID=1926495 RepID=UPI0025F530B6|nr:hypothetical protein [Paraburkholderia sp.]
MSREVVPRVDADDGVLREGEREAHFTIPVQRTSLRTVAFHIFGALDFDALFPYIYDARPWYRPLLFIACQTANFWGVVGAIRCLKIAVVRDGGPKAPAARFAVAMLAAFVVTWLAVYSISAVENRFALPMIAIFIPFAIGAIFERVEQRKIGALLAVTFCAYLAAAAWASLFLSSLRYKA